MGVSRDHFFRWTGNTPELEPAQTICAAAAIIANQLRRLTMREGRHPQCG
jgi:hypothetical protein